MIPEKIASDLCIRLSRFRLDTDHSDNTFCPRCELIARVIRDAVAEAVMEEKETQLIQLRAYVYRI